MRLDAIGHQFEQALLAVDQDPQPRRLIGLPEDRDLVDGVMLDALAIIVARAHDERVNDGRLGCGEAFGQAVLLEFVHQEVDRAAMHAVDRLAASHQAAQRLQHQPVAAKRHDDIGMGRVAIAVAVDEMRMRLHRLRALAGNEGDLVVPADRAHSTPLALPVVFAINPAFV